jgi:ABC-type thiamine transport system ATPase subunit
MLFQENNLFVHLNGDVEYWPGSGSSMPTRERGSTAATGQIAHQVAQE